MTLTPQDVRTEAGKSWTVKAGDNAIIQAGKEAVIEAGETLTLRAPEIVKEGNETARGTGGSMGTVYERDYREHEGSYTLQGPANITGAVVINGTLTVTGGINGKVNGCSGC